MENGLGLACIYQQMWWEGVCVGGGRSHSVCVCVVCVWWEGVCVGCSHSVLYRYTSYNSSTDMLQQLNIFQQP